MNDMLTILDFVFFVVYMWMFFSKTIDAQWVIESLAEVPGAYQAVQVIQCALACWLFVRVVGLQP